MKNIQRIIISLALLFLVASTALCEDDICNMELVSTWISHEPRLPYSQFNTAIDIKGNIIYCATGTNLCIFSSSPSGVLTFQSSLPINKPTHTQVVDDLLIVSTFVPGEFNTFFYNISTPASPESLTYLPDEAVWLHSYYTDSLLYLSCANILKCDISNTDSIFVLDSCDTYVKFLDTDSMWGYYTGSIEHGEEPDIWSEPYFRIQDLTDFGSVITLLDTNIWEEDGFAYNVITKDSIVFIKGPGGLDVCTVNPSRTALVHHNTFTECGGRKKMFIVRDSLIILTCNPITIAKITSIPSLELHAKYNFEERNTGLDFCVRDTFIFVLAHKDSAGSRTLRIQTFKFGTDSLQQCSFNHTPNNFELNTYPNPFNSTCQIRYSFESQRSAKLTIHDIQGKKVEEFSLFDNKGLVQWDASGCESGVYLVRIVSGEHEIVKKVVFIR